MLRIVPCLLESRKRWTGSHGSGASASPPAHATRERDASGCRGHDALARTGHRVGLVVAPILPVDGGENAYDVRIAYVT